MTPADLADVVAAEARAAELASASTGDLISRAANEPAAWIALAMRIDKQRADLDAAVALLREMTGEFERLLEHGPGRCDVIATAPEMVARANAFLANHPAPAKEGT